MLQQEPLPTHDGRPGNRGSICNIGSQLGIVSRPAASKQHVFSFGVQETDSVQAAYCAAKAAVISMTKSDAIDVSLVLGWAFPGFLADTFGKYSKDNIRINCVSPGLVK